MSMPLENDYKEKWLREAIVHYNAKRYTKCLDACERVIQRDPDCARAYHGKGLALVQQKRYEGALIAYQKAAHLAPENAKLHADMAELFYKKGDYKKSGLSYKRAIQLDSQFEATYVEKSKLLLEKAFKPLTPSMGDSFINPFRDLMDDPAINAFLEVLLFNPGDAIALAEIEKLQKENGVYFQLEKVIEAYLEASQLNPEDANLHANLAELFYKKGDYERSGLSYKRAIQLDSQFEATYVEKSKLLLEKAFKLLTPHWHYSQINAFREVLLFNPGDAIALAEIEKLQKERRVDLVKQGRYKEAIEAYSEASQLNPEDANLHANLAELFYKIGDYERSGSSYKRAIQLDSQFEATYVEKSKLLLEKAFKSFRLSLRTPNKCKEAISAFREVLLFNPGDAIAINEMEKIQRYIKSLKPYTGKIIYTNRFSNSASIYLCSHLTNEQVSIFLRKRNGEIFSRRYFTRTAGEWRISFTFPLPETDFGVEVLSDGAIIAIGNYWLNNGYLKRHSEDNIYLPIVSEEEKASRSNNSTNRSSNYIINIPNNTGGRNRRVRRGS